MYEYSTYKRFQYISWVERQEKVKHMLFNGLLKSYQEKYKHRKHHYIVVMLRNF